LICCALNTFGATTTVDVYLDMESGADGSVATAGILNAATHGSGGDWSTTATSMRVSTAFEQPLGSPVMVGSTSYTDTGSTRTFAFRNTQGRDYEYASYTLTSQAAKVSMGCFVRVGNFTGETFGSYDLIAMEGDNGEFAVLNFQDFPGADFGWEIHTQAGVGNSIRIVANKTYWTTMLWDRGNGKATLKVYDPITWSLVGTSTLALQAENCILVAFGRYDAHGTKPQADGLYHYYDDLMIDFSNASFPILPERPGVVFAPISLSTIGAGTISGATNDALLQIDRAYTLTAKPAPGYLFAGWTGSASSSNAALHFVMASNLTFTATFVTNYFPSVKGTYNGLFYDPANTQQQSSGYLTFTVNDRGSYSGKLLLNGKTHRLHGALAPDGTGSYTIARPNTNALCAHFYLDLTNGTDRLDGYVAEETAIGEVVWSSELVLDRATYNRTNPAPNAGRYTIAIVPDTNSPAGPAGESIGKLTLSASGILSFAGKLADGSKAAQRTTLAKTGDWPLYESLYRGMGALLSTATFDTNQINTDLSGPLCWFKQSQPAANYYRDGFTNSTTLIGSRYLPPTPTNVLLKLTNAILAFTNSQLSTDFTNVIELTPQSTIINHSANKLSVKLSKTTGLFSGSVIPPDGSKAISFSGALFQKQNAGAGFFLITNGSGSVILSP
jgi:uncharacterized repeat protein (TIGR02543 family)